VLSDDDYEKISREVEDLFRELNQDLESAKAKIAREFHDPDAMHFALSCLEKLRVSKRVEKQSEAARQSFPKVTRIDKNDAICQFTLVEPALDVLNTPFVRHWRAISKHAKTTMFVKYFRDNDQTQEARRNLSILAEYQILRNFRDANIANVFDAGWVRDEDGAEFPFVATEWLDGHTLTVWRHRQSKAPSATQCATIAWAVAGALARILKIPREDIEKALGESQDAKVFHLDIKPENLMVLKGTSGNDADVDLSRIKIVDFGSSGLPEMATAMGTYQYKAPQRFGASNGNPDPTWDVYSIGGVLYFLVTGREPVPADPKLPREHWNEWYDSICFDNQELTAVTRKCLAYEAEGRYASVKELEEDLYRLAHGYPLIHSKRTYSFGQRLWMLLRRSRVRNDANDHAIVLGGTAVALMAPVNYLWISYIARLNRGIGPVEAYTQAANATNISALLICGLALWLIRFQALTSKVLVPVFAFVLSLPIIMFVYSPSVYTETSKWQDIVHAGMYVVLELAILCIAIGSHHRFCKSFAITGWCMLGLSLLVRPLFESELYLYAMPITLASIQSICLVVFAVNAFIDGPKREDRDSAQRYF
jgi:hypothetical protein